MFYWLLKVFLGPVLRIAFRPSISGVERIPSCGPAILASNHLSFSDSFFLPLMVPRRITFLAKSDYFTGRGIKGRLTASFFRGVGQVPVDRSGGNAADAALETGLRVLSEGRLFGIYPEGTRSPDGRLHKGRTGVARIALKSGAPVFPIAMIGTDKVQPIGQKVPNLGRISIRVGPQVDLSAFAGRHDDREALRAATNAIMVALQTVSGQEYVDEYASTVKEQLAEALAKRIESTRQHAQGVANAASERAAEARARVEEARLRVDAEARARMGEARIRVDEMAKSVRERRAAAAPRPEEAPGSHPATEPVSVDAAAPGSDAVSESVSVDAAAPESAAVSESESVGADVVAEDPVDGGGDGRG